MDILDVVVVFFTATWGQILWIVLLVVLDWILGVIAAIQQKTFKWEYIADFLETNILLKLVAYVFFGMILAVGQALPGAYVPDEILQFGPDVVFGILVTNLVLGSLVGHMIVLGLVPEALADILNRLGVDPSHPIKRQVVTTRDVTLLETGAMIPGDYIYSKGELVEVVWPAVNGYYKVIGTEAGYLPADATKRE